MKFCPYCKSEKDINLFSKISNRKDGLSYLCKSCGLLTARIRAKQRLSEGLCKDCKNQRLPNSSIYCEYHYVKDACRQATGSCIKVTVKQLIEKFYQQNQECPYTVENLVVGINAQLDHVYPKSRFSDKSKDIENLEWVSKRANLAKGDMTKDEFIAFCSLVLERAASRLG